MNSLPATHVSSAHETSQARGHGKYVTFFERVWSAITSLQHLWASSLRLRVITIILIGGTVGASAVGVVITTQERSAIFEQAVRVNVEQFSVEAATAQERFSAGLAYTTGQTQQVANELVASMYDPTRGLMGAVLMRSQGQEATSAQIVEPATASAATLRSLVSTQLRAEVANSRKIAWQSVAVPHDSQAHRNATSPGIVVGTSLEIPSSGSYELYAVYSLESQETLLNSSYRVLSFGIVAFVLMLTLLVVLVLRMVLRPIQEVSEGAQQLAQGALDTRMDVDGTDELARLALSFNQMASSLEDQFTRMERMSEVQTAFVSAVSHELRSPVTTIRMAGQLIYDKREELSPALKRSAELLHDQLTNLDAMLSDLLEISRYDAGGMNLAATDIDVVQIVKKVMEMVQPLAESNGVRIDLAESGDTTAEVEPRRIERIVRNLVVNALEHGEARPVRIRVVGGDDAVAVEVVDHGIGLSDAQAAHVFDRFWRADTSRVRKTGGTGLGLTIAREDALIHGGSLQATGELGVGSAFLLVVPKHPGASYTAPIQLEKPAKWDELANLGASVAALDSADGQQSEPTMQSEPTLEPAPVSESVAVPEAAQSADSAASTDDAVGTDRAASADQAAAAAPPDIESRESSTEDGTGVTNEHTDAVLANESGAQ
ncbi:MAG: MtrAB system histidine kinase MtrB [Actinomycetaceae bacterium]|nr:MtrAB system histidine kinase MtrB [Arcanobacterium sp.]MDD7687673.1 MtrAB system histidine kinase MtrB [Actinomycetaceae bacterium]MDY5273936.1 MtrAB system histidine kinase MtrB [Arcanobacterium sp.]